MLFKAFESLVVTVATKLAGNLTPLKVPTLLKEFINPVTDSVTFFLFAFLSFSVTFCCAIPSLIALSVASICS